MEFSDVIDQFVYDPVGFVRFVYPWQHRIDCKKTSCGGCGVLKGEIGPDKWQEETLRMIGERMKAGAGAVQVAIASGNEIGKTALVAWVIHWFASTRPHPQMVVTANTAVQLSTKTWRELAKWHKMSIHSEWFEWTATRFYMRGSPETWFAAAVPWREEKAQAFAGTHEKHVLMVFDEASTIADSIWEQADQAMTVDSLWLAVGNPTHTTGRFRECFGRFKDRWVTRHIDSRACARANQERIRQQIEDYGEDDDYVRIHVKGEFPRQSSTQFISPELVYEARMRSVAPGAFDYSPVVLGVDVARFGDDSSCIVVRQGGIVHRIRRFRGKDTMQIANHVIEDIALYKPRMTFVDEIGIGAGVVDRLRSLGYRVTGVSSGRAPTDEKTYYNLRAEMWGRMRDWLRVSTIPFDRDLISDLSGPEYGFDNKGRIQLEKKEDMKYRGLSSPDTADALALTFAMPVVSVFKEIKVETEFNLFS